MTSGRNFVSHSKEEIEVDDIKSGMKALGINNAVPYFHLSLDQFLQEALVLQGL
jgi:hypothetical protein